MTETCIDCSAPLEVPTDAPDEERIHIEDYLASIEVIRDSILALEKLH